MFSFVCLACPHLMHAQFVPAICASHFILFAMWPSDPKSTETQTHQRGDPQCHMVAVLSFLWRRLWYQQGIQWLSIVGWTWRQPRLKAGLLRELACGKPGPKAGLACSRVGLGAFEFRNLTLTEIGELGTSGFLGPVGLGAS